MSAPHSMTSSTPCTSREPLSALLRRRTRAAHANAELAFDLGAALADRRGYAGLLGRLHGFYRPAEEALQPITGWAELDPPVNVHARARSGLLEDDLQRLGSVGESGQAGKSDAMATPALMSLAAGLGWLYVMEGSALGGQLVARQARSALGHELPVTFLRSEGRPLGRNWRELQSALDAFGAVSGPAAVAEAVEAATDSFGRFAQWIGGFSRS